MKTIILKFSGPMQSWGTNSHFESRYTDYYPSKSAVIGLIAGSLGYRREDDEKIKVLNDLDYACRVDQRGSLLRDFHTAKKYKDNGVLERTYVTNRYYLEDAVCIVCIAHEDETLMDMIETGLKNPYFQPFMGRRSLPLVADFFIGTKNMGAMESLRELEWQASKWYRRNLRYKETVKLEAYADTNLLGEGPSYYRRDKVDSFSQKNRRYSFRSESRFFTEVKNEQFVGIKKEEHDAFSAIGGHDVSISSGN